MTLKLNTIFSTLLLSTIIFIFCACASSEAPPARAKIRPTPVALPVIKPKPSANMVELTPDDEKRMTNAIFPDLKKDYPPLVDQAVQDYVTHLGLKLVGASGWLHDYEFTFTVVKSVKVNAFSLPGGAVLVTTGLISLMGSEAELAGVIGHEIGHLKSRDVALRLEESRDTEGRAEWYVPSGSTGLLTQKYSFIQHTPEQEMAADRFGFSAALNANFNKDYIGLFFIRLNKINNESKTLGSLADAVASHQPASARVAQLQLMAVESPAPSAQAIVSGPDFNRVRAACKDSVKDSVKAAVKPTTKK